MFVNLVVSAHHQLVRCASCENDALAFAVTSQLQACVDKDVRPRDFSIGHRGTIQPAIKREGDMMRVVDVLAQDVRARNLLGLTATVTYYANCRSID